MSIKQQRRGSGSPKQHDNVDWALEQVANVYVHLSQGLRRGILLKPRIKYPQQSKSKAKDGRNTHFTGHYRSIDDIQIREEMSIAWEMRGLCTLC